MTKLAIIPCTVFLEKFVYKKPFSAAVMISIAVLLLVAPPPVASPPSVDCICSKPGACSTCPLPQRLLPLVSPSGFLSFQPPSARPPLILCTLCHFLHHLELLDDRGAVPIRPPPRLHHRRPLPAAPDLLAPLPAASLFLHPLLEALSSRPLSASPPIQHVKRLTPPSQAVVRTP